MPLSHQPGFFARLTRGLGWRSKQQARRDAIDALSQWLLPAAEDRERFAQSQRQSRQGGPADYLAPLPGEQLSPREAFARLRWGGQVVMMDHHRRRLQRRAAAFADGHGFVIEHPPRRIKLPGLALPGIGRRHFCFVARKTQLAHPGDMTERYSYNVHLSQADDGRWVVVKQVPSARNMARRLRRRMPGADEAVIARATHKLIEHVFPVFLTREAAFLKILQQRLPKKYRDRFPQVLDIEKDDQGFVRKLALHWIRMGGPELSQLEFARQLAELTHVLHDHVGVMHLDLRLDNVVVSNGKVCIVDFGSAVRMGEHISRSPMLDQLFNEMMSTCQVQRVLGRMKRTGRLTSPVIVDKHEKLDKAADLFYVALQINKPHSNPDLKGLVRYRPAGDQALALTQFTSEVLCPADISAPSVTSTRELLEGILEIERDLGSTRPAA